MLDYIQFSVPLKSGVIFDPVAYHFTNMGDWRLDARMTRLLYVCCPR